MLLLWNKSCDLRYVAQTQVLSMGRLYVGPFRHSKTKIRRFIWPITQDPPKEPPSLKGFLFFSWLPNEDYLWHNAITHVPKHHASWLDPLQVCLWVCSYDQRWSASLSLSLSKITYIPKEMDNNEHMYYMYDIYEYKLKFLYYSLCI